MQGEEEKPEAAREGVDLLLRRSLAAESNAALRKGALVALAFAVAAVLALPVLMVAGLARGLWVPWFFSVLCLVSCGALYGLARRERVHGWRAYAVLMPFASLPTFFFLLCHALLPSGAATFLNGPILLLYFITVTVTGFLFDFRLTAAASGVAAAGYQLSFLLARSELQSLSAEDPLTVQDLTAPPIYFIKSLTIFFGGLTVGALAVVMKRLVVRVQREEREKSLLSRLFGQYVSEEVKERLLRDPHAQTGERKELVVLFSDIRGFTEYGEEAEPEDIVRRLNAYFDAMVGAIRRHGGVVDKFIGDAVMATFGGLVRLEEPCAAAVEAAREMRQRLGELNARWAREGHAPFENGSGLHGGEVVLGAIGSEERKDFTVIGDAVNTASRVESLTKQYGPILITGALYARLPGHLKALCQPLGAAHVKGRKAALELHAVEAPPVRQ
jgi:class 3 adenylate cyclase